MATIHVHRFRATWKDRLRTYSVLLDGREVMGLKNGESKAVEVAAGEHEVQAKIDWTSSNTLGLALEDDEVVHLGLANDANFGAGQNVVDIGLEVSTRRASYLKLSLIDPPRP